MVRSKGRKSARRDDPTASMTEVAPLFPAAQDIRKAKACLMIVYGGDVGRKYWLTRAVSILGRDPDEVDFGVSSDRISRRHCALILNEGKTFIKDLGSTNGTFVNGQRIHGDTLLAFGDQVQCGDAIFQFVSESSLETILVDRLKEESYRDALTQVYNKKILPDIEREFFEAAQKDGTPLAVILLDIDRFKQINDTYGHLFGDQVLSTIAAEIQSHVIRKEDVIVRFGGEEFLVVAARLDGKKSLELAERIRQHIAGLKLKHDSQEVPIRVSVGVKCWDPKKESDVQSLNHLIAQADSALYESKQKGRNQVTIKY